MATAVVKASHDIGNSEVELLRQKVIVNLLREIKWEPTAIAAYVKELVQHQVITHEVRDEVCSLYAAKELGDLGCGVSDTPCAQAKELAARSPGVDGAAHAVAERAATPADAAQAAPPGVSRFDRDFERLELLGRGAFGEVWRARSRVDLKEYAVKIVPYSFGQEGPFEHPALREARAWADFQHPNMVRYHAAWVEVEHETDAARLAEQQLLRRPAGELEDLARSVARTASESSWDAMDGDFSDLDDDDDDGGVVFETAGHDTEEIDSLPAPAMDMRIVKQAKRRLPEAPRRRATLYMQTELVMGGTLREWIDTRNAALASGNVDSLHPQYNAQAAEDIFRQLVDVVADLHAQGVVHRDIKPANILLTESGGVRLGDFGLAKTFGAQEVKASSMAPRSSVASAETDASLDSEPGVPTYSSAPADIHTRGVGTPGYASPEQMCQVRYGPEADVHALGMVLLELLVPMWTMMERAQIFDEVRSGVLPEHADDFCPGAGDVVLQMTRKDPTQRPIASELASLLHLRKSLAESSMVVKGHRLQVSCGGVEDHANDVLQKVRVAA